MVEQAGRPMCGKAATGCQRAPELRAEDFGDCIQKPAGQHEAAAISGQKRKITGKPAKQRAEPVQRISGCRLTLTGKGGDIRRCCAWPAAEGTKKPDQSRAAKDGFGLNGEAVADRQFGMARAQRLKKCFIRLGLRKQPRVPGFAR